MRAQVKAPTLEEIKNWTKTKNVANTTVGPYVVSTIRLLMDHGYGGKRPLWFETMVYRTDIPSTFDMRFEDVQERYETKAEAIEGHNYFVEKYKNIVKIKAKIDQGDL